MIYIACLRISATFQSLSTGLWMLWVFCSAILLLPSLVVVFHHHLTGNLNHQYYINTTNNPNATTVRQKNILELSTHYLKHVSVPILLTITTIPKVYLMVVVTVVVGLQVGMGCCLLLGLISMLVFDLLTVSMTVARGSSGGYDGSWLCY